MRKIFYILSFMMVGFSVSISAIEKGKMNDCSKETFIKEVKVEAMKRIAKLSKEKIVHFSNELLKKAAKLELEELALKKRQEQLKILEKNFAIKIRNFDTKQRKIISCLDERDQKAIKRVQHMVSVIAGMRPKNAASLLSVQDSDLTVKILAALSPQKVSKIFNLMDKEVSARLQKQYMTMQK